MSNVRILIVEDESVSALFLRRMLEKAGYQVVDTVRSGEDAIVKAGQIKPDLMLMDIKLDGEINGVEAAGTIQELHGIPSIFMTAYTLEEFNRTYRPATVVEPLQKPVHKEELLNRINRVMTSHDRGQATV